MNKFFGAVVGCGRMGAFTGDLMTRYAPDFWLPLNHSEAMITHPEIDLVGLCDIDEKSLDGAQKCYGVSRVYTDYHRLIDEAAPDVLGIATRTPERSSIIEYAIDSGRTRALHIEKPLCNSVLQLQRLERLFASPKVICTYGTLRRYARIYNTARELAYSGRFGRLQQIQVCFGLAQLLWSHPHSLDIMLFFAGDAQVEGVSANFSTTGMIINGSKIDGDPLVLSAEIQFVNGLTGLISQTGGCDVILACSEGTITIESDGRRIRCRHSDGEDPYWNVEDILNDVSEKKDGRNSGICIALERLVSGLQGKNQDQIAADKRAILVGQSLIFACAQSHLERGIFVKPDEVDSALWISGRCGDRYA